VDDDVAGDHGVGEQAGEFGQVVGLPGSQQQPGGLDRRDLGHRPTVVGGRGEEKSSAGGSGLGLIGAQPCRLRAEQLAASRLGNQRLQQPHVVLELGFWLPAWNKIAAYQAVQPFTLGAAGPNCTPSSSR
jgi:hypothetical protein